MRRRRALRSLLAWLTVLVLAWAGATEAPEAVSARLTGGDGDIIVTDARGVIVGVGRVVAGASFELRLLDGFVGPARLTLLRPDGATEVLDVVVDGDLRVEGFDLLALLVDRVEVYTVEVAGVAYHAAASRGTDAGAVAGDGPRPAETAGNAGTPGNAETPGNAGSPGPPDAPGGPGSSPTRGVGGRP
jgi:hypothetical protein